MVVDVASVDSLVAVDVVVVVVDPGVMTNPQPRAGSFKFNGSEASDGVVVDEGAVVVVVAPANVVVVERVVVVVVDVVDVEGLFLVTSRPTPTNTRPNSTTRRTSRNGFRRAEVFRNAGTLRHGNSEKP
jgi:hypothetical protein